MRTDTPVYSAEVGSVRSVTPRMLRITLRDVRTDTGAGFTSSGVPDEFFGLWLSEPGQDEIKRYYSVREWRAESRELDIDFVVHAHGPATQWARQAAPGQRVLFDEPRGHYAPPTGTTRVLLIGDATALPAIGRILDERAPEDPPVRAILSVDDPADRQDFAFRSDDDVSWVAADELIAATIGATAAPDARTYLWFSGEATTMREVRRHVRRTLGWPTSQYMTMGYWRRDQERWVAEFTRTPDLERSITAIWENGEDDEAQRDLVDELLTRHGL